MLSVRTKITIILILIIVGFSAILYTEYRSEKARARLIFAEREKEERRLFEKILALKTRSIEKFAVFEYSIWSEMVNFIEKPDTIWAVQSIDVALSTYGLSVIWIFDTLFNPVYTALDKGIEIEALNRIPIEIAVLKRIFADRKKVSFFAGSPAGVIEICGATVHPTEDTYRETPIKGYFLAGRLLNKNFLDELSEYTGARFELIPQTGLEADSVRGVVKSGLVAFSKFLYDWNNKPIARLDFYKKFPGIAELNVIAYERFYIVSVFAIMVIVIMFLFLYQWVQKPLKAISKSLDKQDPEFLEGLQKRKNEFGNLANLVQNFFVQREVLIREIAERRNTETALRESEELYRSLIDTSPDAVIFTDLEGKIKLVNSQTAPLFGFDPAEDFIGKSIFDFFPSGQFDRAKGIFSKILIEGSVRGLEYYMYRKDGNGFWCEIGASVIRDAKGSANGIIYEMRDITARKDTETALIDSETRLRTLANSTFEGIVIHDKGTILDANTAFCEMFGLKREELSEVNWRDFVAPESIEIVSAKMKTQSEEPYEAVFTRKDRSRFVCEVRGRPINFNGIPARIVALHDITDRKTYEERLANEKEQLAVTLRSIGEAVVTVDTQRRIVLMNEVAERLTGWSQEDARGRFFNDVFNLINEKNRTRYTCPIEKVLEEKRVFNISGSALLRASDRTERAITLSCAPIHSPDSTIIGVVLVIKDITELRKMEEEMIKADKLESISLLAGGIAHDFNNILSAIITNLSLARNEVPGNDALSRILDDAMRASLEARILNQRLLTFAKGGEPLKKPMFIGELIENIVGFTLRGSNISFRLNIPTDLKPVFADELQISQVFYNLIINAKQAMPRGGSIVIEAENVKIAEVDNVPLTEGEYVKIVVADSGIGIPNEHISKIFDPYFTTKQNGSGLGLATVYSIMSKHEGYITVESELGVGTRFTIYLPISGELPHAEEKPAERELHGKILLMDDRTAILNITQKMLERKGFEVELAHDGNEAIAKYRESMSLDRPFDAVILDIAVPGGLGGEMVMGEILKIDSKAKGIATSGYLDDPVLKNYERYGFRGAIPKPFRIDEITNLLSKIIG